MIADHRSVFRAIPLLTFFLSACGEGREDTQGLNAPAYVAVEELRIGSADDGNYALSYFGNIELGPAGEMFIPQNVSIRVYSARGEYLRSIGREGSGPGELSIVFDIGITGDSVWVFDQQQNRFTYYDFEGNLRRTVTVPARFGPGDTPRPIGLLADGSMYGVTASDERMNAQLGLSEGWAVRVDDSGEAIDSVYRFSVENRAWVIEFGSASASYSTQPFSDTEIVEPSPFALEVARVDRRSASGSPAGFRVSLVEFGGDTIYSREFSYLPRPVPQATFDSVLDRRVEILAPRLANFGGPAEIRAAFAKNMYSPAFYPPIAGVAFGRGGMLWLELTDTDPTSVEWVALSRDGDPVARVTFPDSFRMRAADEWVVWGLETDELDVPYLVRYRLQPDDRG